MNQGSFYQLLSAMRFIPHIQIYRWLFFSWFSFSLALSLSFLSGEKLKRRNAANLGFQRVNLIFYHYHCSTHKIYFHIAVPAKNNLFLSSNIKCNIKRDQCDHNPRLWLPVTLTLVNNSFFSFDFTWDYVIFVCRNSMITYRRRDACQSYYRKKYWNGKVWRPAQKKSKIIYSMSTRSKLRRRT